MKQFLIKTLRWSERYTKIDMVYLFKNSSWLFLQQIMIVGVSFALSVAFGYFVPKDVYGSYRFILSVIGSMAIFCLIGSQVAMVRSIAQNNNIHLYWILLKKIQWGLLGAAGLIIYGIYLLYTGETNIGYIIFIGAIFVPFMDSFLIFDSYLRGKEQFRRVALSRGLIQIVAVLVLLPMIILFNENLLVLVLTYLSVHTLLRSIATWKLVPYNGLTPSPDDKKLLSYSKHVTTSLGLGVLANAIDKALIFYVLGPVSVASYAFALILPDQIKGLVKQVVSVTLPKMSNQDTQTILKKTKKLLPLLLVAVSIGVILYWIIAPYLYHLFFPRYSESIWFSQLVSLSIVPAAGFFVIRNTIYAMGTKKLLYIISTAQPIIQITCISIGLWQAGVIGLIIGIIIAQILGLILGYVLLFGFNNK